MHIVLIKSLLTFRIRATSLVIYIYDIGDT